MIADGRMKSMPSKNWSPRVTFTVLVSGKFSVAPEADTKIWIWILGRFGDIEAVVAAAVGRGTGHNFIVGYVDQVHGDANKSF